MGAPEFPSFLWITGKGRKHSGRVFFHLVEREVKKRNLIKLTGSYGGVLVFLNGMRSVFSNSSLVRNLVGKEDEGPSTLSGNQIWWFVSSVEYTV